MGFSWAGPSRSSLLEGDAGLSRVVQGESWARDHPGGVSAVSGSPSSHQNAGAATGSLPPDWQQSLSVLILGAIAMGLFAIMSSDLRLQGKPEAYRTYLKKRIAGLQGRVGTVPKSPTDVSL